MISLQNRASCRLIQGDYMQTNGRGRAAPPLSRQALACSSRRHFGSYASSFAAKAMALARSGQCPLRPCAGAVLQTALIMAVAHHACVAPALSTACIGFPVDKLMMKPLGALPRLPRATH
jgi:hypothetical protein